MTTEEYAEKIELFRGALATWDAPEDGCCCGAYMVEEFRKTFPPPIPADPIEECRAALHETYRYWYDKGYEGRSQADVASANYQVFTKHFPEKETT